MGKLLFPDVRNPPGKHAVIRDHDIAISPVDFIKPPIKRSDLKPSVSNLKNK